MVEDSTTSSAANSTRRQSAMTADQSTRAPGTPARGARPTTPDTSESDEVVRETPESQRQLHQRKRRRSSDAESAIEGDDPFSSPGDDAESSPIRVEESIDSESDTDGDTAMSLDDATETSIRSSASSGSQNSLDDRLRQAASLAGTRGIAYDETGLEDEDDETDLSMDIADGNTTHAFRQYSGVRASSNASVDDEGEDKENINVFRDTPDTPARHEEDDSSMEMTAGVTMEMTRAVGGILARRSDEDDDATMDMTVGAPMEMTSAVGGILSQHPTQHKNRTSTNPRRRSSIPNSNDQTSCSDETMDFTVAKGGIVSMANNDDTESDEDMTMEMTNVVGGLRNANRDTTQSSLGEETESMDMTVAAGGILPPIQEQTEPQSFVDDGFTVAMDMTKAIGGILQPAQSEADYPDLPPLHSFEDKEADIATPRKLSSPVEKSSSPARANQPMAPAASETGSPTMRPRRLSRRSMASSNTTTPKGTPNIAVPQRREESTPEGSTKVSSARGKGQGTPTRQMTPAPLKGTSPTRTPILTASVTTRGASPKKLFQQEIQQRASPAARKSPRRQQDLLFAKDETTGMHTPRVVLHAPKPHQHLRRKSSGIGIDRVASTSPRVSEVLSRRASLTESAPIFHLQLDGKKKTDEHDPLQLQQQIDAERMEEHRRESGRFVMEQEVNEPQDDDTTHNLRGMIESMTPKKEKQPLKSKNRKSLAVGSAKGLLGKRPAELDEDEDEEATPKRLRTMSREGSPIKSIRLPKGPTIEQTTGKLSKAAQVRLGALSHQTSTPTGTPSSSRNVPSPEVTGKFRNSTPSQKPISFETRLDNVVGASDVTTVHPETVKDAQEEPMSLQEFLNMTNIHFIELSTAKRRHTIAQTDATTSTDDATYTAGAAFVAAASTLPQLDLYQHATRELNSYISSGRRDIKQIESEMLTEQPPIFKEYLDASPDMRAVMDNQFRNVKARARLQSKESWYAWRSQLVDGLQNGLEGIKAELAQDNSVLSQQLAAMDQVLPQLVAKKPQLEQQANDLRQRYEELSSIDRAALGVRRSDLSQIDLEVSQHAKRLSELRRQLQEKDEVLSQVAELRTEMNDQISEARRVQDEQSRWHRNEVAGFKAEVENLEAETGWRLLSTETLTENVEDLGIALRLEYKGILQLLFHPSSFQQETRSPRRSSRKSESTPKRNGPIKLSYISIDAQGETVPEPKPEVKFILQHLQAQLDVFGEMASGSISAQDLLAMIADRWSLAEKVSSEVLSLCRSGIVRVSQAEHDELHVYLMLIQNDRSRIDIDFGLKIAIAADHSLLTSSSVKAQAIYGKTSDLLDASKIRKVQAALSKEIENRPLGSETWSNAVQGFQQWLQAQIQARAESDKLVVPAPMENMSSNVSQEKNQTDTVQKRRAVTASPQRNGTPKKPARSPLAPRTTNSKIQRKALPVPKKSSQPESQIPIASSQKENAIIGLKNTRDIEVINEKMSYDDVFGVTKAAIPPEMQEAMMHTPVKRRVGALRRSPY